MSMMSREQLEAVARSCAIAQGLDPILVLALIEHESSFDPWAIRVEPSFYESKISHMKGLTQTEMRMRACSFSLMQIMGQVARELGFDGKYLTELFEPVIGVTFGCRKLRKCFDQTESVHDALQKYNGGGDPGYAEMVMQFIPKYKEMQT